MNIELPPGNYVAEPSGEEVSNPFTVDPEGVVHWYDGREYEKNEENEYVSENPPPTQTLNFTVPGEGFDQQRVEGGCVACMRDSDCADPLIRCHVAPPVNACVQCLAPQDQI